MNVATLERPPTMTNGIDSGQARPSTSVIPSFLFHQSEENIYGSSMINYTVKIIIIWDPLQVTPEVLTLRR
jgi:hypothetical protein